MQIRVAHRSSPVFFLIRGAVINHSANEVLFLQWQIIKCVQKVPIINVLFQIKGHDIVDFHIWQICLYRRHRVSSPLQNLLFQQSPIIPDTMRRIVKTIPQVHFGTRKFYFLIRKRIYPVCSVFVCKLHSPISIHCCDKGQLFGTARVCGIVTGVFTIGTRTRLGIGRHDIVDGLGCCFEKGCDKNASIFWTFENFLHR